MDDGTGGSQSETGVEPQKWKHLLSRAWWQTRRDPTGRYSQLATVDPSGKPRVRTVVIRSITLEPPTLCFGVDTRSSKIPQIQSQHWVELCWYVHTIREQFRFAGELELVGESATGPDAKLRFDTWQSMSLKVRRTFLGPPPGTPAQDDDKWEVTSRDAEPPACFSVGRLDVAEVDWLSIRGSRLERIASVANSDGAWSAERIRP